MVPRGGGGAGGGVVVSAKHANYILNEGGATGADLGELIASVREAVAAATGHWLEEEVVRVPPHGYHDGGEGDVGAS